MPLVSSGSMVPAAGLGSQSREPVCETSAQGAAEGGKEKDRQRGSEREREREDREKGKIEESGELLH